MRMARITSALTMPQKSSLCWYAAGTANADNNRRMTKTLSMLSVFSTR